MREPFTVEADLDGTTVRIRRPPALRHYQPLFLLAGLSLAGGSYAIMAGQGPLGAAAFLGSIALFVAAAWVMRITPAEHHEVVLSPNRVVVDETVFDAGSLSLILTDEKIVFRDRDHQAEIWHSIQRLDERMRLRTLLEGAIDRARNRHGEGGEEVPEDLRRRPEVHA